MKTEIETWILKFEKGNWKIEKFTIENWKIENCNWQHYGKLKVENWNRKLKIENWK